MKKMHIIAIVVIAVALAIIVSTISNSSTYAPFKTAIDHTGSTFHIVGKVNKNKAFIYNPEVDANLFGFYLVDNEGVEKKVIYSGAKPQDFEKAEQIVVVGKMEGGEFQANQVLMKCPSKYNGDQVNQISISKNASE